MRKTPDAVVKYFKSKGCILCEDCGGWHPPQCGASKNSTSEEVAKYATEARLQRIAEKADATPFVDYDPTGHSESVPQWDTDKIYAAMTPEERQELEAKVVRTAGIRTKQGLLRDFHTENYQRFSRPPQAGVWGKGRAEQHKILLPTSSGDFLGEVKTDRPVPEFMFSRKKDSATNLTGGGGSHEVFSQVVSAIRAYLNHKSPEQLKFSAEEPERRLFYDLMVKHYAPLFPDYDLTTREEDGVKVYHLHKKVSKNSTSEEPVKYQSPALSDFISAVRQIRSSNQEVRRQIAEQQYQKLGLKAAVRDAIADAPHTASANTAQSVEHNGDLDKVRAAATLYAQQTGSPQLLLFHEHTDGQDLLHKFDAEGSAEKLRQALNEAGLHNRTLSPTPTGWSVFFFDPKGRLTSKLKQFTQQKGYTLESSRGTGERVGEGQAAEAGKEDRAGYRKFIDQYEKQQGIQ